MKRSTSIVFDRFGKDILLHALALLLIVVFFLPLFYPTLSLFVTPEVGVSDLWQFNLPVKLLMSHALHGGYVPLWTPTIGMGFPIFAESQMGFFNAFLLFLFSVFPHLIAFNLEFIVIYFVAFSGMYFFLRHLKTSYSAAFLGGFAFAFSGFFITHISHQNMILSSAYIPWIFLVTELFFSTKKIRYLLLGSIIISQQLLGGHIQMTFTTLVFVGLYILINGYIQKISKKQYISRNICLLVMVILAAIASSVQLLPTAELIGHSVRKTGLSPAENIQYSFPFKHFATFLNPFILGSPKDGTYPHYNKADGSIFWENTGYIGLIPLALAFFALKTIRKNKKTLLFSILLLCAAFIMTGKYSPFYFIHTLPVFNGFRVPSRYIIMFIFSLCALTAIGFDEFRRIMNSRIHKQALVLTCTLIVLSIANIFYIWGGYHLIGKATTWFSPSETGAYIKKTHSPGRIFSLGSVNHFVDYFLKEGWGKKSNYLYFRNELSPNYNITEGIDGYGGYVGKVDLNRYISYSAAMMSGVVGLDDDTIHVSTPAAKLIGLASVKYIVTSGTIVNPSLIKKFHTTQNPDSLPPYVVYENPYFLPQARMVYSYTVETTLESIQQVLTAPNFDGAQSVILEKNPNMHFEKRCTIDPAACPSTLSAFNDANNKISLHVSNKYAGLLVLADTYYPGWKAFVDAHEVSIYAGNLNSRVIIVPAGNHTITFEFVPMSFYRGLLISTIAYITIMCLLILEWRTSFLDIAFRKMKLSDYL